MLHRLILCSTACLALASLPASGQSGTNDIDAEPLPAALTDWHRDARDECERGGGIFRDGDYWQTGDFNGDGQPDFLVTRAVFKCKGNEIFAGGTAGDGYEVLVSSRGGYAFASEGILAHDAEMVSQGGKTVVLTPDIDDPGIEHMWAWDGSKLARVR